MAKRPPVKKDLVPAYQLQEALNQGQIMRLAIENLSGQLKRAQGGELTFRTFLAGVMLQEGIDSVELDITTLDMIDRGVLRGIDWAKAPDNDENIILKLLYADPIIDDAVLALPFEEGADDADPS